MSFLRHLRRSVWELAFSALASACVGVCLSEGFRIPQELEGRFFPALLVCLVLDISILAALVFGLCLFLLYGKRKGFTWRELIQMALDGVKTVKNILFTFLLIGMLTALWRALASAGLFPGTVLNQRGRLFYPYTSPTLVLASGCMLLLAVRFKPSRRLQGMLRGAAAASLGVFLIHTTVWYWLIEPRLAALPPARFGTLRAFSAALLIALPCALIDLIRGRLFALLHVRQLTDRVQARLLAALSRLSERLLP